MADSIWDNVDTEDLVKLGAGIYGLSRGSDSSKSGKSVESKEPGARTTEGSALWNVYMDRVLGPGWNKYSTTGIQANPAPNTGVLNNLTSGGGGGNSVRTTTGALNNLTGNPSLIDADWSGVDWGTVDSIVKKYGLAAVKIVAPQLVSIYGALSNIYNDVTSDSSPNTGMYEQGGFLGLGIGNPSSYTPRGSDNGGSSGGPSHAGTGPGGSGGGFAGHESMGL